MMLRSHVTPWSLRDVSNCLRSFTLNMITYQKTPKTAENAEDGCHGRYCELSSINLRERDGLKEWSQKITDSVDALYTY